MDDYRQPEPHDDAEISPRAANGRFTGHGAIAAEPLPQPDFDSPETAEARLWELLTGFATLMYDPSQRMAPFLAIAASPGAGKSVRTREFIASGGFARLSGNIAFYTPTLQLADEAAQHFRTLGVAAFVWRGRSAPRPDDGNFRMCERHKLAEAAGRKGLSVFDALCCRRRGSDRYGACPHFDDCAYLNQLAGMPESGAVVIKTHAMLVHDLQDDETAPGLRVIDESPLSALIEISEHRPDFIRETLKAKAPQVTEELVRFLSTEVPVSSLTASPHELRHLAEELRRLRLAHTSPGSSVDTLERQIRAAPDQRQNRHAARILEIIADCMEAGKDRPERLAVRPRDPASDHPTFILTDRTELKDDIPTLLLDADADPLILSQFFNPGPVERVLLRPRAEIIQAVDHLHSRTMLKRDAVRARLRGIIEAEVFRDKLAGGRGVLVVTNKPIVDLFRLDAGLAQASKTNGQQIFGAEWIWFGPSSRGLNNWKDFGTVIVIGREEPSLGGLETQARAVFGDGEVPLNLLDGTQDARLPESLTPFLMADGSGNAAMVTRHVDPRCDALLQQMRETGMRQAFERLRLSRADRPKRMLLLTRVPVPDLPVDRLCTLSELEPPRFIRALMEATNASRALRLTAKGLHEDAPHTFQTVKAAERWLERGGSSIVKAPMPVIEAFMNGAGGDWGSSDVQVHPGQDRGRAPEIRLQISPPR